MDNQQLDSGQEARTGRKRSFVRHISWVAFAAVCGILAIRASNFSKRASSNPELVPKNMALLPEPASAVDLKPLSDPYGLPESARGRVLFGACIAGLMSSGLVGFFYCQYGWKFALVYGLYALSFLGVVAGFLARPKWIPWVAVVSLVVTTISIVVSPPWDVGPEEIEPRFFLDGNRVSVGTKCYLERDESEQQPHYLCSLSTPDKTKTPAYSPAGTPAN